MTTRYNVAPRYTCGSPAQVNAAIAHRVASEETRAYQDHLEGIYGEGKQQEAQVNGLGLVSFTLKETRKGWEVVDLITGEQHFWSFKADCPTCGRKKIECDRGILREHIFKGGYSYCSNRSLRG